MRAALCILLACMVLPPRAVYADDVPITDLQITGQLGIGTTVPRGRLDLKLSPDDHYGLRIVDSADRPLFLLDSRGAAAIGLNAADARIDVRGGALLRSGASGLGIGGTQIAFRGGAGSSEFSIRTRHDAGHPSGNAIDFYFRRPPTLGSPDQAMRLLTLEAGEGGACRVAVSPVGTAEFELDVSSGGGVPGGGILRYGSAGEWTARTRLADIRYFDSSQAARAYAEIKNLRHAAFRYRTLTTSGYAQVPSSPLVRGLTYDDAPESVRGPRKSIVEDYRVLNLELALKEIDRRIAEAEAKISAAEKEK